ncbi:MAG: tetratricopeptide repeat protein [Pseudomonadota bacterium]
MSKDHTPPSPRRRLPLIPGMLAAAVLAGNAAAQTPALKTLGDAEPDDYDRSRWSQTITDCDRQASHPSDPEAVVPGVTSAQMDKDSAIAVCQEAVAGAPDHPRLNYQLGRALTYAGRFDEAHPYLKKAAWAGYPQALFVLGYVEVTGVDGYEGDPCLGGYLIRRSALAGRFAGLVGLPHYALLGEFKGCGAAPKRDAAELLEFLLAAEERASDFYRRTLVAQLKDRVCSELAAEPLAACGG